MHEYHFNIQYDQFSAELAVDGKCSLYDLPELINKAVGFDFDHAFELCDNLRNPYCSKERYSLFADIGEEADDPGVKTSSVFRARRKMVFHFDYGEDWFFLVTCTSVKESPGKRRLRKVLSTRGEAPVQYPEPEE